MPLSCSLFNRPSLSVDDIREGWHTFRWGLLRVFMFFTVITYFPAAQVILAAFSDQYNYPILQSYQ